MFLEISRRKIVLTKRCNDMIIYCDLTKFHHFTSTYVLSEFRSFNVRRGFLEIFFLSKFEKKLSYKSVMITIIPVTFRNFVINGLYQ